MFITETAMKLSLQAVACEQVGVLVGNAFQSLQRFLDDEDLDHSVRELAHHVQECLRIQKATLWLFQMVQDDNDFTRQLKDICADLPIVDGDGQPLGAS